MGRLTDLDRRAMRALAGGRDAAEQQAAAARRWWWLLILALAFPVVLGLVLALLGLFIWPIVAVAAAFMTIPMTFMAGYLYAERLRQLGVDRPWWMGPPP